MFGRQVETRETREQAFVQVAETAREASVQREMDSLDADLDALAVVVKSLRNDTQRRWPAMAPRERQIRVAEVHDLRMRVEALIGY
jgi:hypothetical protein